MEFAAQTNVGRRLKNEDSFFLPQTHKEIAFVAVADGMGGHAAGKRASTMAVDGLKQALRATMLQEDPVSRLRTSIREVNKLIYKQSRSEEGCRGMGTTLVLALLFGEEYIAANIGDSRLYHMDDYSFTQVTQDHSLVAVLVKSGEITRAEADKHPQRNIITRALGTTPYEEADYFQRRWGKGDTLLLCSDGLHETLRDEEMESVMRLELSLQEKCDMLVRRSLAAGAKDNVTAVLACNGGGKP